MPVLDQCQSPKQSQRQQNERTKEAYAGDPHRSISDGVIGADPIDLPSTAKAARAQTAGSRESTGQADFAGLGKKAPAPLPRRPAKTTFANDIIPPGLLDPRQPRDSRRAFSKVGRPG